MRLCTLSPHSGNDLRVSQCVRAYVYESKVFVSMVLILIFAEVLGLYGYSLLAHLLKTRKLMTFIFQAYCSAHYELKSYRSRVYLIPTCLLLHIFKRIISTASSRVQRLQFTKVIRSHHVLHRLLFSATLPAHSSALTSSCL